MIKFGWNHYKETIPIIIKIAYRTIGILSTIFAVIIMYLPLTPVIKADVNTSLLIGYTLIYHLCQFFGIEPPTPEDNKIGSGVVLKNSEATKITGNTNITTLTSVPTIYGTN